MTTKENNLTSAPRHIHVDTDVHQQVTVLARALGITASECVAFLLRLYAKPSTETPTSTSRSTFTPVYAIYRRRRIEGHFDRATGALNIPSGPAAGQYKTPSGAARAVITALNPQVSPIRTGWSFWRLAETGAFLDVLRPASARTHATAGPPARPAASTNAATTRAH